MPLTGSRRMFPFPLGPLRYSPTHLCHLHMAAPKPALTAAAASTACTCASPGLRQRFHFTACQLAGSTVALTVARRARLD